MHALRPSILLVSARGAELLNPKGETIDELIDIDLPDATCSINSIPNIQLTHCKFFRVESKGALFLDHCQIKKVKAVGRATLTNQCDIGEVATDENGEVHIKKCENVKEVITGELFTDKVFIDMKVKARETILSYDPFVASIAKLTVVFLEGSSCDEFLPLQNVSIVILDGALCKGDIIFPEDSMVPEIERRVVLKNGGTLLGKVVRGYLEDLNLTLEHPLSN